jgi:hypothetical protein
MIKKIIRLLQIQINKAEKFSDADEYSAGYLDALMKTKKLIMDVFLDKMQEFFENSESFPNCPKCGSDDTMLDDNGDYEFFFCTDAKGRGCEWESQPGEYGCRVHDEEE